MMELSNKILEIVSKSDEQVNTLDLAVKLMVKHENVVGALNSIATNKDILITIPKVKKHLQLSEEGKMIVENGSHETIVFEAIPDEGITLNELQLNNSKINTKIGFSRAMANGWLQQDKSQNPSLIKKKVNCVTDTVRTHLKQILIDDNVEDIRIDPNLLQDYKKRKLITEKSKTYFLISKGVSFTSILSKLETDLTTKMLLDGSWKQCQFKEYNFDALGVPPDCGYSHPLLNVRAEFRQIFLEMGFSEMPTNNYVESSFWNFDALFQPQQHPARDAHDTFFVSDPQITTEFPAEYLEKVKRVHNEGGYGSLGYRYQWKLEEAQKNLLRTHTTAVSARMLYKLAQEKEFQPMKLFSIDKVFRNETLDATHLAEFHQVEGVIADYDLTLGNLIGMFAEFFRKLGLTQLQFKPAYNPYTEPSMEIFCFHPGLNKWIEVGNSGAFRPEMLLPMGLPENVSVIAWGLSLERPTMIKYGFNNIRDLVGPKVDLNMVEKSPLCRIEK